MSRSLSRWQSLLLAVVVLGGAALGGFGLFAVDSRQGVIPDTLRSWGVPESWLKDDRFRVRVGFRQVRGVEKGARVRVQGIEAGEVIAVEPPATPGGDVMLRLRLDGKVRHLVRADATAQIVAEGMIGGKVVEISPGSPSAEVVADNAVIASRSTPELTDVLAQLDGALQDVRDGRGTLGKLVRDEGAYTELLNTLKQGRNTLASIKQDADALKEMPLVRNYVRDAHKLLVRPECEPNRRSFAEKDLFEPGRAVLTAQGREELDKLAPWLDGLKHKGSEVVVAASSDPGLDPPFALTLSQKQSEAVVNYLTERHGVQKMGWFSRRSVTPIGLGVGPSPLPSKGRGPRIDVLVFVPRG
jgi:phospholipid/cholesterol/gamma-HCH transport system substrate-binding protein